jgi:hypothetical protein
MFLLGLLWSANSVAKGNDSLVIKLYSAIGEHTLRSGNHIIIKLNYQEKYFRTKIVSYTQDTMYVKPVFLFSGKRTYKGMKDSTGKLMAIPFKSIAEIGYYTWQDKLVKGAGAIFLAGTAYFIYTYFVKGDRTTITPLIIMPAMTIATLTLKRKIFKLPQPWKIQVTEEIKSDFIYH